VADDPDQDDAARPKGAAPDGTQGPETREARPGALDDGPATRRFRRRPHFRGHIVVDDDEPLPVFDVPADPPPAPDGQASSPWRLPTRERGNKPTGSTATRALDDRSCE
jgi:hypothetical protein